MFKLKSTFQPTGDQPQAIEKLIKGVKAGNPHQTLLGVTGSGKTFTIANVIAAVQKPTLIISHNKTLAAQLYQEFRDFFPENSVNYFVSYYDYYQPESYLPQTDTYIEKVTEINEEIDKLRLRTTTNLLTRKDVIVVASVSCIYNLGSPKEYGNYVLELSSPFQNHKEIVRSLLDLQYSRSDFDFKRGTFRVRGEYLDIFPSYADFGVRVGGKKIEKFDPLTGKTFEKLDNYIVYPAKHFLTDPKKYTEVFKQIRQDKDLEVANLTKAGKILEAHRLNQRVEYDLEMISEIGYVNGIENYSRYFDGRNLGDPPYSLLEYFSKDYLLIIDESHMTIPQIRGMYNGDRARKETLIQYGFRLQAALDNRPLRFEEFQRRMGQTIYTSATPNDYELSVSSQIVEQLVRPTGIPDPTVTIRPTVNQIPNLISEITKRTAKKERVLVTTLTKRLAEDLTDYLKDKTNIKVAYLHSEIQTFDRSEILSKLRGGEYDVVIGVNLLREGLDLPEVTLVAILDADKEGFLRSRISLVQTMGRAARNINSTVIMYADKITDSMKNAVSDVRRRRKYQLAWNKKYKITPKSIVKPVRDELVTKIKEADPVQPDISQLTPEEKKLLRKKYEKLMRQAAIKLNFEDATYYQKQIRNLV